MIMSTIVILTGGGDTCALNPTIYGAVSEARQRGWNVYGAAKGYSGLMGKTADLDDFSGVDIRKLTNAELDGIQYTGGSILRSSRTNPADPKKYPDGSGIAKCARVLEHYGIDFLVPIGGDDTMGTAAKLSEGPVNAVGVNKTMDNDVKGTYVCLGFPSTVHYATDFSGGLHSTLKTNGRDAVVYAFGRKAGWAPLATAAWIDPERPERYPHAVLVPELGELTEERIIEVFDRLKTRLGYAQLVVSEGVAIKGLADDPELLVRTYGPEVLDDFGHANLKVVNVPLRVAEIVRDHLGLEGKVDRESNVLYRNCDYNMRSGPPTEVDRELAMAAGRHAVELLADGVEGRMVNITAHGDIAAGCGVGSVPFSEVSGGRTLDAGMYDPQIMLPTRQFTEYVAPFAPNPRGFRLFDGELPKVSPVR